MTNYKRGDVVLINVVFSEGKGINPNISSVFGLFLQNPYSTGDQPT